MEPRKFISDFTSALAKKRHFLDNADLVNRVTEVCAVGLFDNENENDSDFLLFYAQNCYKIFPHGEFDPKVFDPDPKTRAALKEHQSERDKDNTRQALLYLEALNVMVDALTKRRRDDNGGVRVHDADFDKIVRRCRAPYRNKI